MSDVLRHYGHVWPSVQSLIASHSKNSKGLILEGSALLPEFVYQLDADSISAVWLTADNEFLKKRIYDSSSHKGKPTEEQFLINKFYERTIAFNTMITKRTKALNLRHIDVDNLTDLEEMTHTCLQIVRQN